MVHAAMLKVLAENLQLRKESSVSPTKQSAASVQADGLNASPGSDLSFEFESYQDQPMNFQLRRELPNVMSLPTFISDPATPLVDRQARRSSRLSARKQGFFQLDQEPSKRHQVTAVKIDEATKTKAPIPITTLQEWGIDCGVAPSELTADALMAAPTSAGVNDMQEE